METANQLYLLLGTSILLLLSVLASKASSRLGIPALLVFLGLGMLAGSEGLGGIPFDSPQLAQSLGVIALAFILFSGGMDTDWEDIRPVLGAGLSLSTLGVFLTAAITGALATLLFPFSWKEGMLLGAIVSSTDAAAVFSVLRSRGASLKGNLRPLLELESGSNDPMAVLLTLAFIQLLMSPQDSIWKLVPFFAQQMTLGVAAGYLFGRLALYLINHINLEYEGLYPVLTIAIVIFIYSVSSVVNAPNPFLAVYIAGLVLGNGHFIHKLSLKRFHDGVAWLMQIAMFLALGLLVFPSRLLAAWDVGVLLSLLLIFIARPASVFISLAFAPLTFREKLMISWVGLRGSVPIILATFPFLAGVEKANAIFNAVFFIVLLSVALQGTSLGPVAQWLGLAVPSRERRYRPLEFAPIKRTETALEEIVIPPGSGLIGKQVVELGLPPGVLLVLLSRGEEFTVPQGNTTLHENDTLTVLAPREQLGKLRAMAAVTA